MIEKIDKYIPLKNTEIDALWDEIVKQYNENLKQYNVKLPTKDTMAAYQLIYLYKYKGKFVHKDVISDFVNEKIENAGKDQQVRHLKMQKGFNIANRYDFVNGEKTPNGYHMLIDLEKPSDSFTSSKRITNLKAESFEDLKKAFNYCCATCGAKEGNRHRVTNQIVVLQQGHMDPSKELTIDNCIPQCQYCNQNVYKNDFIFNANGYPEKIFNPKYVLRSDEKIQEQMLKELENQIKNRK